MSQYKEININDNIERLIESVDNLTFTIENMKKENKDYSEYITNILTALKEIGKGYKNDGCLNNIHHELHLLNRTMIMSALLLGATKTPEKTLNEYHKIINQYLN